jgi:hypothetical protein
LFEIILGQTISGISGGLLSTYAVVTILFAVFYHKGIKMNNLIQINFANFGFLSLKKLKKEVNFT